MSITNGSVTIEDGVKAAEEYAPARKVSVNIVFSVPEGDDGEEHVTKAGDLADHHVKRLLGKATTAPAKASAARKAPVADKAPATPPAEKVVTKADLEAALLEDLGGAPEPEAPKAKPKVADKPKPAPAPAEDLGDILGEDAPKPVTDAELAAAAQKKNATQKEKDPSWAPAKIRDLVAEYAGAGKQLRDIPAAQRAVFLEKLEALK